MDQIERLVGAGCEIVRVTAQTRVYAANLENIAREVMLERDSDGELNLLRRLGFGHCRLSVAVPEDSGIDALDGLELRGCRVRVNVARDKGQRAPRRRY